MPDDLLLRGARPVPLAGGATDPVDVLLRDGLVERVTPAGALREAGVPTLDAGGRWLLPGLWDAHVHLRQWSHSASRLDLSDTASAAEVVARVAAAIGGPCDVGAMLVGFGHRSATWPDLPTVAALDAVTGERPTVLVSGDAHQGWLNSAALRLLGVAPRTGALDEDEWFPVFPRMAAQPDPREAQAYARAVAEAHALGIVGVGDMEFEPGWRAWPERVAGGIDSLRVRTAAYAVDLDELIATGLRSGDPVPGAGPLVVQGPFKIISDGSLNTRTAYCCEPYSDHARVPGGTVRGKYNQTPAELTELLTRATRAGLRVAVHAIGDAAATAALDSIAAAGARGAIEHAQLIKESDIARMAALGVVASVQPGHLLDDRDVAEQCWADRTERCFMFSTMINSGVRLALGSDAPVAPLDPWLAVAAAVHRSADARAPWHAEQALTPAQALTASTDGITEIRPGGPGDVLLLDADPLAAGESAEQAQRLRSMPVALTVVAGRVVHSTL